MATEPVAAPGRVFSMRSVVPVATLIVMPVVLLLLNDSWAFTPVDSGVDPWFYTGLFKHFPEHLREFAGTYYVTRLPHIAVGAAAHAIFEPIGASYTLRLFYWYLTVFAAYATVQATMGSRLTAFLAAMLLGTSVYFLWAIGWDYVDGAGAAWLMASACMLTLRPTRGQRVVWWLAGICQVFAATTYILVVVLLPLQLLYAAFIRLRRGLRPVAAAWIGAVAAGWLLGGGLLALLNWVATGRFNFIAPQLHAAVTLSADRAEWKRPTYEWILGANWLFLAAVACVCALAFIAVAAWQGRTADRFWRRPGVAESIPFLAGLTGFAFMETRGFWALQLSYVAIYLLPFSVLVVAAALSMAFARVSERTGTIVGLLAVCAALVPFIPDVAQLYPALHAGMRERV